ncbi:MAG: hypothetical protein WCI73_17440, partial [Phycisphaerae bacterium]
PMVRQLIDMLHDVGICPKIQIICSGGVFNRAEGLAEEIGSDLFAPDPLQALELLEQYPSKRATPEQQTVGRKRGRKRPRRPRRNKWLKSWGGGGHASAKKRNCVDLMADRPL